MSLQEACKESLKILKQVMEEKLNSTNVEVRSHDALFNISTFYTFDKLWGYYFLIVCFAARHGDQTKRVSSFRKRKAGGFDQAALTSAFTLIRHRVFIL